MEPRVVVLGLMGSGKTTVGRTVERMVGWRYVDNDDALVQAHGKGPRELGAELGVEALHELEVDALAAGLQETPPVVVAAAAGVVEEPRGMDLLRSGDAVIVYLRGRLDTLVSRVRGSDRPWVQEDPEAVLSDMLRRRELHYLEVADVVLNVDDRTPEEIAQELVARVNAMQQ